MQHTLAALLQTYAKHLEGRGASCTNAVRSLFRCYALHTKLASSSARKVRPQQVAALIRPVVERGKERSAGLLRSYLYAAYELARRSPFDPRAPSAFVAFRIEQNPVAPIPALPVRYRERVLSEDELRQYVSRLGDSLPDLALKLALLAGGQRMQQLLRVRVSDYDCSAKTLRLLDPKGRRTQPRVHVLPLAPTADELVRQLIERAKQRGSAALFDEMRWQTPGKRLARIRADMGCECFDLRDVRRTAESMLAALGVSRDIRAQLLSHGLGGIQARYDRHSYITELPEILVSIDKPCFPVPRQ